MSHFHSFSICWITRGSHLEFKGWNVGNTIINQPFGNGSYRLFMVIWGMVYYCFTDIGHVVSQCFAGFGHAARLDQERVWCLGAIREYKVKSWAVFHCFMEINGDIMGFHGDFMEFNGDIMGISVSNVNYQPRGVSQWIKGCTWNSNPKYQGSYFWCIPVKVSAYPGTSADRGFRVHGDWSWSIILSLISLMYIIVMVILMY